MPTQVLLCTIDRVELEGRVKKHLEVCIEKSSTLMNPVKKKTDGAMSIPSILPWKSVPTSMWWACRLGSRAFLAADRALFVGLKVNIEYDGNHGSRSRMLGQYPAQQRKASLEDGIHRAEVFAFLGNEKGKVI